MRMMQRARRSLLTALGVAIVVASAAATACGEALSDTENLSDAGSDTTPGDREGGEPIAEGGAVGDGESLTDGALPDGALASDDSGRDSGSVSCAQEVSNETFDDAQSDYPLMSNVAQSATYTSNVADGAGQAIRFGAEDSASYSYLQASFSKSCALTLKFWFFLPTLGSTFTLARFTGGTSQVSVVLEAGKLSLRTGGGAKTDFGGAISAATSYNLTLVYTPPPTASGSSTIETTGASVTVTDALERVDIGVVQTAGPAGVVIDSVSLGN